MPYTLLLLEDWEALYNEKGKLIFSDHRLDGEDVLRLLEIDYEIINGHIDDEVRDFVYENDVPSDLSELPRT